MPESKYCQAFCIQVKRKQRHSDGTFSLDGTRIEVLHIAILMC